MSIFTKLFGIDKSREQARKAAADALAQQKLTDAKAEEQRIAMENMRKNFSADLLDQTKATVIAGGSADALTTSTDLLKKKQLSSGIASSLGLTL
jgi:hypothetical protein